MLRVALSITKFKRTICNVMNDERFEFLKQLHIDKRKFFFYRQSRTNLLQVTGNDSINQDLAEYNRVLQV